MKSSVTAVSSAVSLAPQLDLPRRTVERGVHARGDEADVADDAEPTSRGPLTLRSRAPGMPRHDVVPPAPALPSELRSAPEER